jgi:hypothetical protein
MRVAIPHSLTRQEVRDRMRAKTEGPGADDSIGGMAKVSMRWIDDDQLAMDVTGMGFEIPCSINIEDHELVFDVNLPAQLSFVGKMIEGTIREKGLKLLS